MELRTTFVQSNLSIATIEGNSEKGRIRQGGKNLVPGYNPYQLLTRSCGEQMHE